MKKKIKDCTFKEFTGWANARACDGRSLCTLFSGGIGLEHSERSDYKGIRR